MKAFWKITTNVVLLLLFISFFPPAQAANSTTVRVAFAENNPPYQFVNREGEPEGLFIDLMDELARRGDLEVVYVPFRTSIACNQAFGKGEVDIVLGLDTMYSTNYGYQITNTIFTSTFCKIGRMEIEEGKRESIAYEFATLPTKVWGPLTNTQLLACESQSAMLEACESNLATHLVGDKNVIMSLMEEKGISEHYKVEINYLADADYHIIVPKGDTRLLRQLNNSINELRTGGEYEELLNTWIPENEPGVPMKVVYTVAAVVGAVFLLVLVYIYLSALLRRKLRQQVEQKTAQLQQAYHEVEKQMEKVKSESALRSTIVELSPLGMASVDRENKITAVNSSLCLIADISTAVVGQNLFDIPLIEKILKGWDKRAFIGECCCRNQDFRWWDGQYSLHAMRYSIIRSPEGAIMFIQDITSEENEKQALLEGEKNAMLNQMIAGISHEIKNPLTGIRGFAELIPEKKHDERFLDYFSQVVPKEVDRINKLIIDLINYARPAQSIMRPVAVRQVVEECRYLMVQSAQRSGIVYQIDVPEDLSILADQVQIKQVLQNIILNAVESLERRRKIDPACGRLALEIRGYEKNGFVNLKIRDTGIGMSPEEVQNCLKPFYTKKASGTGLGLAVTKDYVNRNNGFMEIESQPMQYTVFTLQFRAAEHKPETRKQKGAAS